MRAKVLRTVLLIAIIGVVALSFSGTATAQISEDNITGIEPVVSEGFDTEPTGSDQTGDVLVMDLEDFDSALIYILLEIDGEKSVPPAEVGFGEDEITFDIPTLLHGSAASIGNEVEGTLVLIEAEQIGTGVMAIDVEIDGVQYVETLPIIVQGSDIADEDISYDNQFEERLDEIDSTDFIFITFLFVAVILVALWVRPLYIAAAMVGFSALINILFIVGVTTILFPVVASILMIVGGILLGVLAND